MIPACLNSVREGTSSQERGSNDSGRPSGESITSTYTHTPRDSHDVRRSAEERRSYESARSGVSAGSSALRSESSVSDHFMELQEVHIVDPPEPIPEAPPAPTRPRMSPFARQQAFRSYREQLGDNRTMREQNRAQHGMDRAEPSDRLPRLEELDANSRAPASASASFVPKPREPYRSSFEQSMGSMQSADSIPTGAEPGAYVVQQALDNAARGQSVRSSQRGSSIPHRVRISLDRGPDTDPQSAVQSIGATLVKKRRRLPWKLLLCFGIVSCLCLIVALTTLSIGIYNFTKLRASRAAKTVAALSDEILPKINAIIVATGAQMKRRFM